MSTGVLDQQPALKHRPGIRGVAKKVGVITGGVFLVLGGIAMLVLPGPGLVAIAGGLAIMATEIPWLRVKLAAGFDRLPDKVQSKTPQRLVGILHPDGQTDRRAAA